MTGYDSEEDYEVDASSVYRSDVGNLAHVKDMAETLAEYGYHPDDLIERREICKMYDAVKVDMEAEIHRLAHSNCYEAAKELRRRLTAMRSEFDSLQTVKVSQTHTMQSKQFDKAVGELRLRLNEQSSTLKERTEDECRMLKEDLALSHAIQMENLELEISKIEKPRVKYSKRVIELVKAETELIRLSQYDDAYKVRRMLEKLLPVEEKRYYHRFDAKIADKRINLQQRQKQEWVKLEEKVKGLRWNDVRKREKLLAVGEQRIHNHEHDMSHAQLAESKLKPEMSIKPSALWVKRSGYTRTSAAMRGDQMLQLVRTGSAAKPRGGKDDAAPFVFATPLTGRHDFEDHSALSGTYTLS